MAAPLCSATQWLCGNLKMHCFFEIVTSDVPNKLLYPYLRLTASEARRKRRKVGPTYSSFFDFILNFKRIGLSFVKKQNKKKPI